VTHPEGQLNEWINAPPAPGAKSFPVGTMIVKEVTPPDGENYAGDPPGGCNGCHRLSATNDYVKTSTLALGGVHSGKLARD
jgi:hypothetical protein